MSTFIKYGDIEGQAQDPGHEGWMRVDGMSWGITRNIGTDSSVSGEREAGNARVSDLQITRRADKATPKLVIASCCGKGQDVEIDITKTGSGSGSETYLRYTLKNALISGFATNINADTGIPMETITLAFTEFTAEHTPHDDDGNPLAPEVVGFNTVTNQKA